MNVPDFEYAIKKDVRNNLIVREVDSARHRALWRTALTGALLVVIILFWTSQRAQLVSHGYTMQTLQRQRTAEEEINRHLRLEIETLRSPRRIEELATRKLHLVQPAGDMAVVIERVTAPDPPSTSIIAAR
jgi:cell division protein FtsL